MSRDGDAPGWAALMEFMEVVGSSLLLGVVLDGLKWVGELNARCSVFSVLVHRLA